MGIFKLFGKKPPAGQPASPGKVAPKKTSEKKQSDASVQDDEALQQSLTEKKHIARATERKIDAIEFEMSRDMGRPKPGSAKNTSGGPLKRTQANQFHTDFVATDFQSTIALNVPTTELLLGHTEFHVSPVSQSESVPLLEEAAILFATGQSKVAEHMLRSAIDTDTLGAAAQSAWFMLFDLYQIEQNQYAFESLSLDYAGKYETSPPVWRNSEIHTGAHEGPGVSASTPCLTFPSKLDGDIVKLLQKMTVLSENNKVLQLDFARVKAVDPVGCGLLLRAIRGLKKTKHDLILVAAQNLTEQIRGIIQVGRRDETEAPWLLLLEVLQLLQLKENFEETSIDYCITFEVSPPAYEVPANKVTTAATANQFEGLLRSTETSSYFLMPKVIEGKTELLLEDITTFAEAHDSLMLDCSALERVEFSASAQLLNGLVPISNGLGKAIQFHHVNYLVMHLFNAMGLKNVAAIFPRKQS
ncbi:MAG: STAS domain-containing protein [Undibacterium sp.]|nr:STAS domain-containing protein [Undibacterium sp.]